MNASSGPFSVSASPDTSFTDPSSTPATSPAFGAQKPAGRDLLMWVCIAFLATLGSLGLSGVFIRLWDIWTTDPLRSIGMLIVPASVVLVLRVWRQTGWELRGNWWGLLLVALALAPMIFSRNLVCSFGSGPSKVSLFPRVLPLYLYASGIVLLFAGSRVWRRAWFPLVLLFGAQPVPEVVVHLMDLPLQSLAAQIARTFASLIGFPPTNPELLRLMFTPDFGMFIAPGCDGMRGAVTLGYTALIVGYLKGVSIPRWILYVSGAVLLGHVFNLIRLCALVLYYRIAVGHPALENFAKQADYVIGACLLLVAAVLFFWVVSRKENREGETTGSSSPSATPCTERGGRAYWKVAVFAILVLIAAIPGARTIRLYREFARNHDLTPKTLDDRIPRQIGGSMLARSWQEQLNGITVLEKAEYKTAASNQITLGIWLQPFQHNLHDSLMTHGESPQLRAIKSFVTAKEQPVFFDTAFYSDGITDSFAGNAYCSPSYCLSFANEWGGFHLGFTKYLDFTSPGVRFVPIFFQVDMPHADAPKDTVYKALLAESESFLSNVDLTELSQTFQ